MDLESKDGASIRECFTVGSESNKINWSPSPKNVYVVREITQSPKPQKELEEDKIFQGKRNCIDKKEYEVNLDTWAAQEKQNDVILSNESSSDVRMPEPKTSFVSSFKNTSPIWKALEALFVFNNIPQKPHFMKLESMCKEERDGQAIGMMVTYANLTESIRRLPIDTEVTDFEAKIACLVSLEENGFTVDPIRSLLRDLLAIKKKYATFALKRAELESTLANKEQEHRSSRTAASGYEAELEDIGKKIEDLRKSIAELEEKKKVVMEEKARLLVSTFEGEHILSRLREEISSIEYSHELNLKEFERIKSRPLN